MHAWEQIQKTVDYIEEHISGEYIVCSFAAERYASHGPDTTGVEIWIMPLSLDSSKK